MKVKPDRIDSDKIEEMRKIFSRYPQIQAVYLFGSQLSGKRRHRESDVDIGVFVDRYDGNLKLEIVTELTVLFNRIDLVMMESRQLKDLVLAYEIVKENHLIYRRADFDHPAFFSRVVRMYLDFVPLLEVRFSYLKKRLESYGEKQ